MNLKQFVGKACTVFTTPINRNFDEKQLIDYFVGIVEEVDSVGILTRHPVTGCKNFYPMAHVVGLAEERVGERLPAPPPKETMDLAALAEKSKALSQKPSR